MLRQLLSEEKVCNNILFLPAPVSQYWPKKTSQYWPQKHHNIDPKKYDFFKNVVNM